MPFMALLEEEETALMTDECVLIIDEDAETIAFLRHAFAEAGVSADAVHDACAAIEKLRERTYSAIVLDPMIRHRLNGYAVLNFIELEQPQLIERLYLLTGMSEQTIRRTAPAVASRMFRKPSAAANAADAVIAACGSARAEREPRTRGSVLLIEDDHITANATIRILVELGYTVEWVEEGADAIAAIADRRFDAVMLDLVLPDFDGFTLLEHFRSDKPGLLKRVIITSGMPARYLEAIDRSAVGGILEKPLEIPRLERLLDACMRPEFEAFEGGGETP
jgi:DNA-binding NtrC family response regulator